MPDDQQHSSVSSPLPANRVAADRWTKPVLVGPTVTLRPVVADDADAMWEMVHDTEGSDLTGTVVEFTYAQIADWAATRESQPGRLDLAIVENATGIYAGEAVLNEYDPVEDTANFRISLRGPAWYGRGLGTEATRLIVDHGLNAMGLAAITLEVLKRNPRARRAYEKAGFVATEQRIEDGEVWIVMRSPPPADVG